MSCVEETVSQLSDYERSAEVESATLVEDGFGFCVHGFGY